MLTPSRRSMGSASATMSSFWSGVKDTRPTVVSAVVASIIFIFMYRADGGIINTAAVIAIFFIPAGSTLAGIAGLTAIRRRRK